MPDPDKMVRVIKHLLFIFIILFEFPRVNCQVPDEVQETLVSKFTRFCDAVPREEIYLITDREEYIAGEELWLSVHLIDRQSSKYSSNSRISYIELLDAENKPVVQKKILLNEGMGSGQIIIPDTLSSGTYLIRAYTSWMKNFTPDNFYMKFIKVYNTLRSKTIDELSNRFYLFDPIEGDKIFEKEINTGVIKKVNNSRPDSLEIYLFFDESYISLNKSLFYIFIQTQGNIDHVSKQEIKDKETKYTISKSYLSYGINQITVFNSNGTPAGERYIYTRPVKSSSPDLHSPDSVGLREKITLNIECDKMVMDGMGQAFLNISVSPETGDRQIAGLADYMVFGTEYGSLPLTMLRGRKIGDLQPEKIDSILLRIKSRWLDWREILKEDPPHFRYQNEKEKHILSAKLIESGSLHAGPGQIILMCKPGKIPEFQYSRTDNEGNFSFDINIDDKVKDLIIIPDQVVDNNRINIESPFSDQYLKWAQLTEHNINKIPPYIPKWGLNYQVTRIFDNPSLQDYQSIGTDVEKHVRFYGKPDFELIMDDYIKLPEMQEVIFELLPQVSVRKKNSGYDIIITDRLNNGLIIRIPGLFIDGVMIKDPSLILNLNPEVVEKIDVIRGTYLVGRCSFDGIINVITRSGNFTDVELPGYMTRFSYRVIDPSWSFTSHEYSSEEKKSDRLPDYRNTLYWNPSVKTGPDGKAQVEFWSSDNKGDYRIIINGMSKNGEPISITKVIRVR